MLTSRAPGPLSRWFSSLMTRMLVAFIAVVVGAIGLVAAVAAVAVDRNTATLLTAQRDQLRAQVSAALSAAYAAGRGAWTVADLASLQATANAQGLRIVILDANGTAVGSVTPGEHDHAASPSPSGPSTTSPTQAPHDGGSHDTTHLGSTPAPMMSHDSGQHAGDGPSHDGLGASAGSPAQLVAYLAAPSTAPVAAGTGDGSSAMTVPIVVDGVRVGTAQLTLPAEFDAPITQARDALLRSVLGSAFLALALAVAAAVFVSRRLSRPVLALTAATRALAAQQEDAERLLTPGPGELGDLARAFATMAAALRRQEELRRSVVADVAHELRTPVTILRGQTEQLLDGIEDPTPARLVSLHDEVLRLQRLTDDLSALSAADAAGLTIAPAPVDLADVVRRADEVLRPGLDEAGLELRTETEDGLVVLADHLRLTQVVDNLMTNAAKFTPAGGTVTTTVRRVGAQVELVVEDTGPGIPQEELPHVFERFWRGSTAGGRRGTGIGLAVVEALVTAQGGEVSAESPAAGGARFTVRLPALSPDDRSTPVAAGASHQQPMAQQDHR